MNPYACTEKQLKKIALAANDDVIRLKEKLKDTEGMRNKNRLRGQVKNRESIVKRALTVIKEKAEDIIG